MKSARAYLFIATAAFAALLQGQAALAQVPPHKPGEVCDAGRLWCWKKPAGKPGASCSCPSPFGTLPGTLK
ncbi:MAG: hypothetical protein ABIW85_02815 [Variovorax sp.]